MFRVIRWQEQHHRPKPPSPDQPVFQSALPLASSSGRPLFGDLSRTNRTGPDAFSARIRIQIEIQVEGLGSSRAEDIWNAFGNRSKTIVREIQILRGRGKA